MLNLILVKIGSNSDIFSISDRIQKKFELDATVAEKIRVELSDIKALSTKAKERKGIFSLEKEVKVGSYTLRIHGAEPLRLSLLERLKTFY